MLKAFVSLIIGLLLLTASAKAETVRLAVRNISTSTDEMIIDIQDACGLKAVNIGVQGGTFWLWDLTVAYRAATVTRDKFHVNKALRNSATGWIPLETPNLCVRRFYLELEAAGPNDNATVTVFGQR